MMTMENGIVYLHTLLKWFYGDKEEGLREILYFNLSKIKCIYTLSTCFFCMVHNSLCLTDIQFFITANLEKFQFAGWMVSISCSCNFFGRKDGDEVEDIWPYGS